jgi:hypothetical protein
VCTAGAPEPCSFSQAVIFVFAAGTSSPSSRPLFTSTPSPE